MLDFLAIVSGNLSGKIVLAAIRVDGAAALELYVKHLDNIPHPRFADS